MNTDLMTESSLTEKQIITLLNPISNQQMSPDDLQEIISKLREKQYYQSLLKNEMHAEIRKGNVREAINQFLLPIAKLADKQIIRGVCSEVSAVCASTIRAYTNNNPEQNHHLYANYIEPMITSKLPALKREAFSIVKPFLLGDEVGNMLDNNQFERAMNDVVLPLAILFETEGIGRDSYKAVLNVLKEKLQMPGRIANDKVNEIMDHLVKPIILSNRQSLINTTLKLHPTGPLNKELKKLITGNEKDRATAEQIIINLGESKIDRSRLVSFFDDSNIRRLVASKLPVLHHKLYVKKQERRHPSNESKNTGNRRIQMDKMTSPSNQRQLMKGMTTDGLTKRSKPEKKSSPMRRNGF